MKCKSNLNIYAHYCTCSPYMALISHSVKDYALHLNLFCGITVSFLLVLLCVFKYISRCEGLFLFLILLFLVLIRIILMKLSVICDHFLKEYWLHVLVVKILPYILYNSLFFYYGRSQCLACSTFHQVRVVHVRLCYRFLLKADPLSENAHQSSKEQGCYQYYYKGRTN